MGKRSSKLAHKEEAIKALFRYVNQQSGKTQFELEKQFIPNYYRTEKKHRNLESAPGKQWSRWANGPTQPEIKLVKQLFDFCVEQLISGEWKENGQEVEWADLLVAVSDQRTASLSRHRFALKIAYSSLNAPSIITKEMIRGIEVGYYIPPAEDVHKLFFLTLLNTPHNALHRTDRGIIFRNEAERKALEVMLKEIEANYGESDLDKIKLTKFKRRWGLNDDGVDWADQLLLRMQEEVTALSEIANRLISLGGGFETTMVEAQIGDRIKHEAMKLKKRIEEVSMEGSHQKVVWKNDLHFFNVKAQGLDGTQESRYLSVVEVPEKDQGERHALDLHSQMFASIL